MKKRLLMQVLAVVCVVSAYAYNVGDFIYSPTAKFAITGENLVTNGCFDQGDGSEGWSNLLGTALADNWKVSNKQGPNGENVIESLSASADSVAYLTRTWELPAGTYTVSFWIRGASAGSTTVGVVNNNGDYTTPGDNYINFFVAVAGTASIESPILTGQSFDSEWKQIVGNVTLAEAKPVCFAAKAVATGVQMTGFEIYPVSEVYDTRIMQRTIDFMNVLIADENLPDKSALEGPMAALQSMVNDPAATADKEAMTQMMTSEIEPMIVQFFDDNAGDTESGDWSTHGYSNWNRLNNATVVGSWKTLGDRWGFSPNDESLERPAGDGYVLTAGIQRTFNLDHVGVQVTRTDLLPGKYLIYIEAQATAAANNASPYGSNDSRPIVGPTLWVGKDSVTLENDTINSNYWKRYYHIAEVKEGETVNAGFLFPSYSDGMGGRYSLRNPMFRKVGNTTTQITYDLRIKDINTQQVELKNRIDNYLNDVADKYWGKDSLRIAIANATPVYENSLTVVKADGSCEVPITEEGVKTVTNLKQQLLDQVNAMGRAKNWVNNINLIQDTLRTAISDANASLASEGYVKANAGLRTSLTAAVTTGQGLIDALTDVSPIAEAIAKNEEYTAAKNAIRLERMNFEMSAASRAYPAALVLANANFEQGSGSNIPGWYVENGTDMTDSNGNPAWRPADDSNLKSGRKLNAWRGTTVAPMGKANQKVTLTQPGLYEYRVKAYAIDDTWAQFVACPKSGVVYIEDENTGDDVSVDTIYCPRVMVFFGPDGGADSLSVSKSVAHGGYNNGVSNWDGYRPLSYSVFYNKTTTEPEVFEFGLESKENDAKAGVCGFGFGDNEIYYVGNEADYIAAADKMLTDEAAKVKEMMAAHEGDDWIKWKVKRYLFDHSYPEYVTTKALYDSSVRPTTAGGLQNAILSLREMASLLDPTYEPIEKEVVPTGINLLENGNAQGASAKQGVYNLQGVKMDGKNLKKGLYIINGKKFVVK